MRLRELSDTGRLRQWQGHAAALEFCGERDDVCKSMVVSRQATTGSGHEYAIAVHAVSLPTINGTLELGIGVHAVLDDMEDVAGTFTTKVA